MFRAQAARQIARAVPKVQQRRAAHAISNPTLANIEKRWETMAPQEQADLWMALRDRMKVNWAELTLQEKKAGRFLFSFHCATIGVGGCQWRVEVLVGAGEKGLRCVLSSAGKIEGGGGFGRAACPLLSLSYLQMWHICEKRNKS